MSTFPYKGLVLEGGGTSGIGHIGALETLAESHILEQLTHFVGSSVGSIVAMILSCKGTIEFMRANLFNKDFNELLDKSCCTLVNLKRLYSEGGWYVGDELENWCAKLLTDLGESSDITFEQIYQKYGSYLEVTVTDYTLGTTIYLNHTNYPTMPVKTAVRRSCLMPIVFQTAKDTQPTPVNENGQIVWKDLQHVYADGGLLDNYPMHRLDALLPPEQVIGFKLISTNNLFEIKNPYVAKFSDTTSNAKSLLPIIFSMLRDQALKYHVNDRDWQRTIPIDVGTVSSTDFNLTDQTKSFLIQQGKQAATDFIATASNNGNGNGNNADPTHPVHPPHPPPHSR